MHLPVVDVQDLGGLFHLPRLAVFHHHAQEDVVILRGLEFGIEQALFEAPRPGEDLVTNNVALVEQAARIWRFRVQRQTRGLRVNFALADIVVGIQESVRDQLFFMRQEDRQAVRRPFVIVVDPGQILPFGLHNRLITHRACAGVNGVMRIDHPRVVEVSHKLLQLFIRGRAVINDDQLPVIVILT